MNNSYEVIIVGGSYAGLSAALALGRSLRQTLVIDSSNPCNAVTPHSHNFLTQDGIAPADISAKSRRQIEKYETVQFYKDFVVGAEKEGQGFSVKTESGGDFYARKLIFATGLKDLMPDIDGFAACWGKTVIHCPYCHGYEVRHKPTGILANGEKAHHYATLISNWTDDLTVFTHGPSTLTSEQTDQISKHGIPIIETPIQQIIHEGGSVKKIELFDGNTHQLGAIYSGPEFVQHSDVPAALGCELNEQGLLTVDGFQKTTVPGVFACGDNCTMRSVALAVASGHIAGVVVNKELIEESF